MNDKNIKVCLVCVCYNAYEDAIKLLNSIEEAYDSEDNLELTVVLSDNSTSQDNFRLIENMNLSFKYIYMKNDNVGYFPAFNLGVQKVNKDIGYFNYTIVSNVDLVVDSNFFQSLKSIVLQDDIGLIAPQIISEHSGKDSNPKIKNRPTKRQIQIMRLICSSSLLFSIYQKVSFLKLNFRKSSSDESNFNTSVNDTRMYGAHGAFMIFTSHYFKSGARIDYPRFLFGEEGFVAEELRSKNLKINHEKSLIIYDREHGSTSIQPSKFICNEHKKSYDYFYMNYLK
jgi:GT2 family glycosyltransferase